MKSARLLAAAAAASLCLSPAARAQEASAPLVVAPVSTQPVLRTGTELPLRLLQQLTTENKQLRVGYRFRLEVSEPVVVNGYTVIPAGTPAVGEITEVRNKGMWGKSGKFMARLLYVSVNGRQIRLTGEFDDKGNAGGAAAVAVSAVVFLPAGFFMTGTSARIPAGSIVKSFIDEDVLLALPSQPAPLPAVAPAAAPAGVAMAAAQPLGPVVPVSAAQSGNEARCWRSSDC